MCFIVNAKIHTFIEYGWIWFHMVSTDIQAKLCKKTIKNHLCIHHPNLPFSSPRVHLLASPLHTGCHPWTGKLAVIGNRENREQKTNDLVANAYKSVMRMGLGVFMMLYEDQNHLVKKISGKKCVIDVDLEGIYCWLSYIDRYCPTKTSSNPANDRLDAPSKRHSPRGCCLWTGLGIEYLAISQGIKSTPVATKNTWFAVGPSKP